MSGKRAIILKMSAFEVRQEEEEEEEEAEEEDEKEAEEK